MSESATVRIPIRVTFLECGESTAWIDVCESRPGLFVVKAASVGELNELCLGCFNEDPEMEEVCRDLRIWNEVWLTSYWFRAPSLGRLIEALGHTTWFTQMMDV